jgi:lauroyl/myristoyl acyltransferase
MLCWCREVVRLRRRVVLHRVAAVLPSQHHVARESYTYAALSLLWLLRLESVASPQSLISLDDEDAQALASMRRALLAGSHAIITTGHIGFWEILPAALARPAVPVQTQWIVYRPLHDAAPDDVVASLRDAPDRRLVAVRAARVPN